MRAVLVALLTSMPVVADPPTRGVPDAGTGWLDRAVIAKAVKEQMPRIQGCAEEALVRGSEGPRSKLVVRFVIGVDGRVREAEVDGAQRSDGRYQACVLEAMRRVKTPPPDGGVVVVHYPLIICGTGF